MSAVLAARADGLAEQICDKLARWSEHRDVVVAGYEIEAVGNRARHQDFRVHVVTNGKRAGGFRVMRLAEVFVWGFWMGEHGKHLTSEDVSAQERAWLVPVLGGFHRALVLAMVKS